MGTGIGVFLRMVVWSLDGLRQYLGIDVEYPIVWQPLILNKGFRSCKELLFVRAMSESIDVGSWSENLPLL